MEGDRHIGFLECFNLFANDFRTMPVSRLQCPRHRMAAHHVDLVFVGCADPFHCPLDGRVGLFRNNTGECRMIEAEAGSEHVAVHQIRGVLDALLFLSGRTGRGDLAPVYPGVSARFVHLLQDHD
jgi:hypothetical protein